MNDEHIGIKIKAAFREGLVTGYHEGMSLGYCGRAMSNDELMESEWEHSDSRGTDEEQES